MAIDVDQETQILIDQMLKSGSYRDTNELLKTALRFLDEGRSLLDAEMLESLEALEEGLEDVKAGRLHSIDEVFGSMKLPSEME